MFLQVVITTPFHLSTVRSPIEREFMSEKSLGTSPTRWGPLFLLTIAYLGFISLGLPDPVAGVAWPSVRDVFGLHQSSFGLVFIALGCGYCASGFFGGKLTQVLGLGNLLWFSSVLVAVAMFGSGFAVSWTMFVACACIWGLGSGGIDAGLNAYGSRHFSSRQMNWLHACYSFGATLGPLLMTAMIWQLGSWRMGYYVVGSLLFAMGMLFLVTRNDWETPLSDQNTSTSPVSIRTVLSSKLVWLQIVMFLVYVGLEFTTGQWCYTVLTESRGVTPEFAGILAGCYYLSIGVGRVIAGMIAPRIGVDSILYYAMRLTLVGTICYSLNVSAEFSALGLILTGLGLAPIFPSLMMLTPVRLGDAYATHAVGFQVSAGMIGTAIIPGVAGIFAERMGLQIIPYLGIVLAVILFATHLCVITILRTRQQAMESGTVP
jgi:fucose permease